MPLSTLDLVALAWARTGWAKYLQGDFMEAMGFLQSAWLLSQSGTVENRVARVLEKEGQREKVRHALALAVAAGGGDAAASRERLLKLSATPEAADNEIADAAAVLLRMRTITLPALPYAAASAQFALTFDSSNKPERVEWLAGSADLRKAADLLREQEFPVTFPDVSSVKIVRKATLSCAASGCALVLQPVEGLQSDSSNTPATTIKK